MAVRSQPAPPVPEPLVLKALTFSDTTFEVSKTGRIVLPRAQVEGCLLELLRRGGVPAAASGLKHNLGLRLSVDLMVIDQHNQEWVVTLKTWQNVVSGQHRPTFVLENTAPFMQAHGLTQGDVLALCPAGTRLQMRTDMAHALAPTPKTPARSPAKSKQRGPSEATKKRRSTPYTTTKATKQAKANSGGSPMASAQGLPPAPSPAPSKNSNWTSADVAAATVLMAMSTDSSSQGTWSVGAPAKQESSDLSGASGSSPSVVGEERSSPYKKAFYPETEKKEHSGEHIATATIKELPAPPPQVPASPFCAGWGDTGTVTIAAPPSFPLFNSRGAMWPGMFERAASTASVGGFCPPGIRMSRQVSLTTARSSLPELTIARSGVHLVPPAEVLLRGQIL